MPATAASTSTSDRSSMSKRRLRPPSSFVESDENDAFNYAAGENTPLLISVSKDTTSNSATSTPTTYNASTTVSLSTSATNYTLGTTPGATNTSTEGIFPKQEPATTQATKSKQSSYASYLETKAEVIELILSQPEIDLWKLRKHALTPGGLVNDSIRKRAWPKLVGLDHNYDPLQIEAVAKKTMCTGSTTVNTPAKTTTIEIDAQHELKSKTNSDDTPPLSTLIVESMDSAQIERDVARCTWHLLTGSQRGRRNQHRAITKAGKAAGNSRSIPNNPGNKTKRQKRRKRHTAKYKKNRKVNALLKKKQHRLSNLINLTLAQSYDRSDKHLRSRHIGPNRLRYYQGYHDVASIFLHALGGAASNRVDEASDAAGTAADNNKTRVYRHYSSGDLELPSKVLCQVSFSHFKDALRSDFLRLQTGLRLVLFPLLSNIDREVHDHLLDADMEPFFCLSWILTWFSHDVRDTSLVKRLFDAFLVGHPSLPVYAALAMMTHPYNRRVILETDCDFASLHQCLASLPKHSCKVGYKAQPVEGFDGVVVYVSDCEEEEPTPEDDVRTVGTAPSEMGDSQYTFDTQSQYTNENDSIYTESSFPISLSESQSQYSDSEWVPISGGAHTSSHTAGILSGGVSYATGSNTNYNDDRTMISTEGPDFLSKESTLISGTWNDPDSPVDADTVNEPAQVLDDPNPVPFESILEKSLELIRDHPPRELVDLAKRYYQDDWDSQLSLISSNNNNDEPLDVQDLIGLLGPTPPQWSTTSSCTSDWVDKQKQRQDLGRKPTSRKDRRKKRMQQQMPPRPEAPLDLGESSEPCNDDEEAALPSSVDPMDYIRSNPHDPVVAAIGYGPGMEEKNRKRKLLRQKKRRRRRRRAMLIGCGVVTIGAIAVAMVMMNQRREANKIQTNEIQTKPKDMTESPQPLMRNLRRSNVDKAPKISSNSNSAVPKAANNLMPSNQQSSSSVLSMGRTSLSSVASTANTKRTPIAVLPTRDHLTTVRANKTRKLPALLVDPNRSIMDSKFNVTLIAVNINKVLHKMDEKFNVTLITVNINEALRTTKIFLWNNFVRHVWWLVSNGVLRPTKRLLKAIERSEVRADDIIH